VPSPSVRGA
jgi:hypothetical protein